MNILIAAGVPSGYLAWKGGLLSGKSDPASSMGILGLMFLGPTLAVVAGGAFIVLSYNGMIPDTPIAAMGVGAGAAGAFELWIKSK